MSKRFLQTIWAMMVACGAVGCSSTTGSFAYQVVEASERSKYTRDTEVTEQEKAELDKYARSLEIEAPKMAFNDAGATYAVGQATDAATVVAVAGSAAGIFGSMSDLSMGMFGAMALFDSSHIDKAKLFEADLLIVREIKESNSNKGSKGFVADIASVHNDLNTVFDRFAKDNGWVEHSSWGKNYKRGYQSKGFSGTGMCKEGEVFFFNSFLYSEKARNTGHSVRNGVLDGKVMGKESSNYNVTSLSFSPKCADPNFEYGSKESFRSVRSLSGAVTAVLFYKLSLEDGVPGDIYFYVPPDREGMPVPALINNGNVHWMVTKK